MKSKDQDSSLWLSIGYITSYVITIGMKEGPVAALKTIHHPPYTSLLTSICLLWVNYPSNAGGRDK